MDIQTLEKMNESELEQLDTDAKKQEITMLENLNMYDEKINKLDREITLKEMELSDLKKTKAMLNKNLRVLKIEGEMIVKYLWKVRKMR